MMIFLTLIWPRSWRSFAVWAPLILVGIISCFGLSLATGLRAGVIAQSEAAVMRDGPPGLPPRSEPAQGPLRASRTVVTGYGPLVITVFAGEPDNLSTFRASPSSNLRVAYSLRRR